jgi:hypothetical protein
VPDQPKNRHRMVRFSRDDWHALGWLAGQLGRDRSVVLRDLARWWMRVPGAKLPERPTTEQVRDVPPPPDDAP